MNIDEYNGDCTISRIVGGFTEPDRLRIDRADPHVRIAPDLLDELASARHPDATIEGDVLRIVGVNRTVEYRIGEAVDDGFGHRWYCADRIDP